MSLNNGQKTKIQKNIIDTKDFRGIHIIFTYKKWKQKSKKHVWLKNARFLSYLEKALQDPNEVWPDYGNPKRKNCYYYRYGINMYAKIVVWMASRPAQVITAYDCTGLYLVKENKYPELRSIYEK